MDDSQLALQDAASQESVEHDATGSGGSPESSAVTIDPSICPDNASSSTRGRGGAGRGADRGAKTGGSGKRKFTKGNGANADGTEGYIAEPNAKPPKARGGGKKAGTRLIFS